MESEIEAASFRGMEKGSTCLYESEGNPFVQELDLGGDSSHQIAVGNDSVGCGSGLYGGVTALGALAISAFIIIRRKKEN